MFVPLSLAEPTERSRPHLEWGTAWLHRQLPASAAVGPLMVPCGHESSVTLSDGTQRTFQPCGCSPSGTEFRTTCAFGHRWC